MKLWAQVGLLGLLASGLWGQTSASAKPGRLEGRVVNAVTKEAVRKATVTLRSTQRNAGGQLSVTTDAEGKFVFENLTAGDYSVSAEKAGFVRPLGANLPIAMQGRIGLGGGAGTESTWKMGEGAVVGGVELKLVPQGVVTGRVLDEDGEGFGQVQVAVWEWNYSGGLARLLRVGGAETNEVGEFRVANLAPGKYLLSAECGGGFAMGRARRGGTGGFGGAAPLVSGNETFAYARTYYPGVSELDQAQKISLAAGQELSGVTLNLQKTRVFSLSGNLPSAQEGTRYFVNVRPAGDPNSSPMMGGTMARVQNGAFTATNLLPGNYELTISEVGEDRKPRMIAQGEAVITNSNVENVALAPVGTVEIKGRIRVEGEATGVNLAQVRVEPRPRGLGLQVVVNGGNQRQMVEADGSFRYGELIPGTYTLRVEAEKVNHYVKAVTYNGQDIRVQGLDLRNGGSVKVEVLLSPKVAALNGKVDVPEGAAAGTLVVVEEPYDPRKASGRVQRKTVNEDGSFALANLAPGTYRLLAVGEVETKLIYDPEWLAARTSETVTVEVREGETKAVSLRQAGN
ncbi:MAG: carboxypeptidase-like regulatory domain-containing protein [Bryobacter sp.]|nr:carboxypeptidase-like regulatory domain-containing protein [Bryobacter sp.]